MMHNCFVNRCLLYQQGLVQFYFVSMLIVNDAQLCCQQEQEKERELLEDRLTTIKNYDAEATKRMKELRESQLLIEKKEVCWLCSKITAGD